MNRTPPLALVALIALGACADEAPLEPRMTPDAASIDAASLRGQSPPGLQRLAGVDAEFAQMAREIHGFGGMFYDDAGYLNVYMARSPLRATRGAAIKAQVGRSMEARGRPAPAADRIIIREADFDFDELARQSERMLPVLTMSGVVYTDIDESLNRLRIGIEEGVPEERIHDALRLLDVPLEVVRFEVTDPIVPLTDHTLRTRQQPLAGGLQLVMPHPQPGFIRLCTLGFNVLRQERGRSENLFMTNSHCTEARGEVTGYPFYQQPIAPLNPDFLIGIEVEDPPFFTSPCFVGGWVCRWSDAALVRYVTSGTPVVFGSIYRTEYFGTGNDGGSLVVEQEDPKLFFIRGERPAPLMGEVLDKVGRTTGWTRGPVIGTCIHTTPGFPIAMLCQDRVQAMVAGGDSGSPVFQQIGDSKDATLYGILWGGSAVGGLQTFVFSSMGNIELDFGELRTH